MTKRVLLGVAVIIGALVAIQHCREPTAEPTSRPAHHEVQGTVRDTAMRAIGRAVVRAVWIAGDAAPRELARTTTRASGSYVLPLAPPLEQGILLLAADADGFGTTERRVEPGAARQDFVLVRGTTAISLVVIDEAGRPVEGSEVVISLDPISGDPDAVIVFSGRSDANGRFAADRVPVTAGVLHWSAVAPGKGRALGTQPKRAGSDPIALVARLDAGAALGGAVVDRDDHPVPGVVVRASEVEGPWVERAQAGDDGHFRIAGAPRGAGLAITVEGDWALAGTDDAIAVTTPRQGVPAPIRIVVEAAGTITGRVTTASGPVPGARVSARPSERSAAAPREAVAGADGWFELRGLRTTTRWDLEARHAAHAPVFVDGVAARTTALELRMTDGGGLAGRVVDRAGRAHAGVEVYAHRVARSENVAVGTREYATVRTGADGRFLLDHLNPGDYRVEFRAPARMAFSPTSAITRDAAVVEGEVTLLEDAQIERPGRLRIIARAQAAPAWLTVSFLPHDRGGAPHQIRLWGRAGVFEAGDLEPGVYDVAGHNRDTGHARAAEVRIAAGELAEIELAFPGTLELRGRIVDAAGAPVVGATADAFRAEEGSQRDFSVPGRAPDNFSGNSAFSDDAGWFRITGLTPGEHRLRITRRGLPPVERIAIAGQAAPVIVRLPRAAALEVAIAPPLHGADKVVLAETDDGGGHHATAITDTTGAARLTELPPGTYRVGAVLEGFDPVLITLREGDTRRVVLAPSHDGGVTR